MATNLNFTSCSSRESSYYSRDFEKLIAEKNGEKIFANPKVALILQAVSDSNGALTNNRARSEILDLAEDHVIAYVRISSFDHIDHHIQQASQLGKVMVVKFDSHGRANSTRFGHGKNGVYRTTDVNEAQFRHLDPNGVILLSSCSTGLGLAQKIADVSKRTVIAPLTSICGFHTYQCPDHGLEAWGADTKMQLKNDSQTIRIFKSGKLPAMPCFPGTKQQLLEKYKFQSESLDNPHRIQGNYSLGHYYFGTTDKIENKTALAIRHLGLAAIDGELGAQTDFLTLLREPNFSEDKYQKEFEFLRDYSKKSTFGKIDSFKPLHLLNYFYQHFPERFGNTVDDRLKLRIVNLHAICGDYETAIKMCKDLIKRKIPQSDEMLADIYYMQGKTAQSPTEAYGFFETSSFLGHPRAKQRLSITALNIANAQKDIDDQIHWTNKAIETSNTAMGLFKPALAISEQLSKIEEPHSSAAWLKFAHDTGTKNERAQIPPLLVLSALETSITPAV